jgi:hypothetical protein
MRCPVCHARNNPKAASCHECGRATDRLKISTAGAAPERTTASAHRDPGYTRGTMRAALERARFGQTI